MRGSCGRAGAGVGVARSGRLQKHRTPRLAARNAARMAQVLMLQFDTDPACAERCELLRAAGFEVAQAEPRWPEFFDAVAAYRPSVIVIAASRIPTHALEAARYLGEGFATRDIPVILVDVRPEDRERAARSAPRARIVERGDLVPAVKAALGPVRARPSA
jgi:PleD family two-component response regulator